MKLLIIGHGRHGKDTVAEMLQEQIGLTFRSSSEAAAEIAVFPTLGPRYGYKTVKECFDDRANHRQEWKDLITAYNTPDKARLCREILETSDCYVGMRCPLELAAVRPMFGAVIWVEASARRPSDPTMLIPFDPNSMLYIDNNFSLGTLHRQVKRLGQYFQEFRP